MHIEPTPPLKPGEEVMHIDMISDGKVATK
jgi:hypothetical protein